MRPDAEVVRAFLARVSRRLAWRSAAEGAAGGLAVAVVLAVAGWPSRYDPGWRAVAGGLLACIGILTSVLITRRRTAIPAMVERRVPDSRNLVLTAGELSAKPGDAYIASLVLRRAAALVQRLDVATLFPARRATAALVGSVALWLIVVTPAGSALAPSLAAPGGGANAAPDIDRVEITVTPPAYSGQPSRTLRDPQRVEALAGSRLAISVRARASRVAIETLSSRDTLAPSAPNAFATTLIADADGYIAIEPSRGGKAGPRRLVGLTVIPDTPPKVRITAPGHDVFLRDGHRSLDVAIEAGDDIGLASLRLRYTKVSGSGERFTFAEGDVPLQIARNDALAWTARVSWSLDSLGLVPGDMVVYRAVATDHRPGAPASESDSFIAEVLSPGGEAAPGFAVDPEQDRYAVSQQMVILKTERLLARRASMSVDDYGNEAQQVAAEQRKVRAEFVFMLGGELADAPDLLASMTDINEEAEAQGEQDLLAGRAANAGHIALLRAIRAMSRAAAALTNAELTPALGHERVALTQLESAFSRARILLRALTTRERLDLSRRLTGSLADAVRDAHPSAEPAIDSRTTSLRRTLSGVAALASAPRFGADAPAQASALAERVLRVDASAKPLQDVSALLASAATAIAGNRADDARRLLDRAATGIATVLRADLVDAPVAAPSIGADRMSGVLTDALRHPQAGARR